MLRKTIRHKLKSASEILHQQKTNSKQKYNPMLVDIALAAIKYNDLLSLFLFMM